MRWSPARHTVIDDDGVLVVVDSRALVDASSGGWDGSYPGPLVDLMRAGSAVAWQYTTEGDATVTLQYARDAPAVGVGPCRLEVSEGLLWVLPWSQLTMALSDGGRVEPIARLSGSTKVDPGLYAVWVAPGATDSEWAVTLVRVTDEDILARRVDRPMTFAER